MRRHFIKGFIFLALCTLGLYLGAPFILRTIITSIPSKRLMGIKLYLDGVDIALDRLTLNGVLVTQDGLPLLKAERLVVKTRPRDVFVKGISAVIRGIDVHRAFLYPAYLGGGLAPCLFDATFKIFKMDKTVEAHWRIRPVEAKSAVTSTLWFHSSNGTIIGDLVGQAFRLNLHVNGLGIGQGGEEYASTARIGGVLEGAYHHDVLRLKGELRSTPIFLNRWSCGKMRFGFQGTLNHLAFNGTVNLDGLVGDSLVLEGNVTRRADGVMSYGVHTKRPLRIRSLALSSILPSSSIDLTLTGGLGLQVSGTTCEASGVELDGVLSFKGDLEPVKGQQDLKVRGMSGAFHFLVRGGGLYFSPNQVLTIKRIRWGKIVAQEIRATYGAYLYPRIGVHLNQIKARWAGGLLFLSDLSLSPPVQRINGTLFCDRLNLAEALSQLGFERVYGNGVVSGKVPFSLGSGEVRINDGVLFSQPGKKGIIKMSEASLITGQLPRAHPLFGQLQFASAALKEFEYTWVNVLLNMKGDDLVVTIQLDGTPAHPIPFRYDPRKGGFVPDHQGPGIRQEMRIDVNLSVPLNEIVRLGSEINEELLR